MRRGKQSSRGLAGRRMEPVRARGGAEGQGVGSRTLLSRFSELNKEQQASRVDQQEQESDEERRATLVLSTQPLQPLIATMVNSFHSLSCAQTDPNPPPQAGCSFPLLPSSSSAPTSSRSPSTLECSSRYRYSPRRREGGLPDRRKGSRVYAPPPSPLPHPLSPGRTSR